MLNTISLQRIFGLVHVVGFTCCLVITWEAMLVSAAQQRLKSIANGAQSFWRRPSERRKCGPHLWVYLRLDWVNSASRGYGRNGFNVWALCSFPPTTQLTRPQQDSARWGSIQLVSIVSTIPAFSANSRLRRVAILSPRSCSKFLSYITGWTCVIAWQCTTASSSYLAGTLIQGLLVLNYPNYEFQRWHGTLLHIAIVVVSFFVNTVTKPLLPAIELFFFGLHVTGFLALMVPLIVLAPKASADEVFATFYNGGGWSTDGLSFFIGLSATMFAFVGN